MLSRFAEKLKSTGGHHHYLVKGFDFTGMDCWFYLKVMKSRAVRFEALIVRQELVHLADFGEILKSGYGLVPADLG